MNVVKSSKLSRAPLVLLLVAAAVLIVLSFLPDTRAAISSSETRFTELSQHGLGIMPASCESNPSWYHYGLPDAIGLAHGQGYESPGNQSGVSLGGYVVNLARYVCVVNNTGNNIFIPTTYGGELDAMGANAHNSNPNLWVFVSP